MRNYEYGYKINAIKSQHFMLFCCSSWCVKTNGHVTSANATYLANKNFQDLRL